MKRKNRLKEKKKVEKKRVKQKSKKPVPYVFHKEPASFFPLYISVALQE
jgi:hypothetical protein